MCILLLPFAVFTNPQGVGKGEGTGVGRGVGTGVGRGVGTGVGKGVGSGVVYTEGHSSFVVHSLG